MYRWIRKVVSFTSLAGALALVSGGVALANEGRQGEAGERGEHRHGGHRHGGLVSAALKLDTLTGEQRAQIEKLVQERKAAGVPVRQADAVVLTQLAHQVEQDKIDRAGLKDGLDAEQAAAAAARTVEVNTLAELHGMLTTTQRNQLVDAIESKMPKGKAAPAGLETFRGESFDASAMAKVRVPGEHAVKHAETKLPSLSPAQRAELASKLRERAAHESKQ